MCTSYHKYLIQFRTSDLKALLISSKVKSLPPVTSTDTFIKYGMSLVNILFSWTWPWMFIKQCLGIENNGKDDKKRNVQKGDSMHEDLHQRK